MPEGANRKGISGQGRLSLRPGKPDALKDACPVWEEAVGNVPQGNALAAYFIKQASHFWPGGGNSSTAPLPIYEKGLSLNTGDRMHTTMHQSQEEYTIMTDFRQLLATL